MLNTLSRTVSRTLVPQEVHELVIKLTLEVSDAERGFLFMLDEGHLRCKAGFDREGNPLTQEGSPLSQSILQKVLSTHEPMIILGAMTDEELQYQASIMALNLRTVRCVPLTAKEETVGLIYVDSQAVRSFTQSDLDLLEAIASHASIAVENASLYGQLTERASELETMVRAYEEATLRASIDFLTGTYNRRHFIDTFRRDFAQSRRYRRSLALMMIDLDHFKSFNDTYGHPMGDRALQTVAQIIQQTVRAEDVVARYGGEEFIVGLPDTDLEGALIVAERIRSAVAEYPIEDARSVTVSIGTALCQTTDERIAELIERADQALYEAKKRGRNQVCVK
jgi:diguanylate cyclase (GGDEF)-like protein